MTRYHEYMGLSRKQLNAAVSSLTSGNCRDKLDRLAFIAVEYALLPARGS